MGYKARPHGTSFADSRHLIQLVIIAFSGPAGPPEENWISAIISVVCGIMYFAKALDFWQNGDLGFQSAFSLNKVRNNGDQPSSSTSERGVFSDLVLGLPCDVPTNYSRFRDNPGSAA